jgi:hypothetical protein
VRSNKRWETSSLEDIHDTVVTIGVALSLSFGSLATAQEIPTEYQQVLTLGISDQERLTRQFPVYDALYAYASQRSE